MRLARCNYDKPHRCPASSGTEWGSRGSGRCDDVLPDGVRRWKMYGDNSVYGRGWWYAGNRARNLMTSVRRASKKRKLIRRLKASYADLAFPGQARMMFEQRLTALNEIADAIHAGNLSGALRHSDEYDRAYKS